MLLTVAVGMTAAGFISKHGGEGCATRLLDLVGGVSSLDVDPLATVSCEQWLDIRHSILSRRRNLP